MTDSTDLATNLLSTAVALVIVLALAWVSLRALKRFQQGRVGSGTGSDELPQVMRSVGLGPRERLVTVRYRGRDYLLGVTAAAINVIDSHAAQAEQPRAGVDPS